LQLTRERLVVQLELTVAAGEPARSLRQSFDRDGNGMLDEAERAALADHLARTAALRTKLTVDGRDVDLRRAGPPQLEGSERADSTAFASVRVALEARWPAGSGDWLGRRAVVLRDEAATGAGHVPAAASCSGCKFWSSSSGAAHRDERGVDHVVAAEL